MKSHPHEVSDWIKSKKKDVVPFVNPSAYGLCFTEWWGGMQPSWQLFWGLDGWLNLVREAPKSETWQGLRKGGTAGMYTVVLALSWWIKVQCNKLTPMRGPLSMISLGSSTSCQMIMTCQPSRNDAMTAKRIMTNPRVSAGVFGCLYWPYSLLMCLLAVFDSIKLLNMIL